MYDANIYGKDVVVQIVKKLPHVYGTRRFTTDFASAEKRGSLLRRMDFVHNFISCFLKS